MHPIVTSHTGRQRVHSLRFKWAQLPKSIDYLTLLPQSRGHTSVYSSPPQCAKAVPGSASRTGSP